MNNRNQPQTARGPAPAEATAPTYLNVFTVEEYESNGKKSKKWTKIGAAFPHKDGIGFSIELRAFPIDGRLVALAGSTRLLISSKRHPASPSRAPLFYCPANAPTRIRRLSMG